MADFDFRDIETIFQGMGIYEVVLPFLLCFTIIFAFLQKTQILGNLETHPQAKKFNIVIAIVMGLLLVRVHELVDMINMALPKISVVIVAVVMFFILIAMFNEENGTKGLFSPGFLQIIVWLSAIVVGIAFWTSYKGAQWPSWLSWVENNLSTIIVLGIFALILVLITGGDGKGSGSKKDEIAEGAAAGAGAGAAAGAEAADKK